LLECALDEPIDVDAGCVDFVRIQLAWLYDLLDFGDCDTPCRRNGRIEVPGGVAIDDVAVPVRFPALDEREIAGDGSFENVVTATEGADFLAFCNRCSVTGRRVERRDARAARANAFRQSALRDELHLELTGEKLPLERGILADVGSDHLLDLPFVQQKAEAEVIDAAIVGDDGEPLDAHASDLSDEVLRDAAKSEPSNDDGHVVCETLQGLFQAVNAFIESSHANSLLLQVRTKLGPAYLYC